MKVIICLAALIAVALAAPVENPGDATILRYVNENEGVEGYKFEFESSDGIAREEEGEIEDAGTEDESLSVIGSYKYTLENYPEGGRTTFIVTYTADKNGFVPVLSKTAVL